jgi:EAL and modified HD-GYP domain-containing signal transduction protein
MTQLNVDARETLYVARQPILDAAGAVFGYELLYRGTSGDDIEGREDLADARVLTDAVLSLGLETITGGKPAFLNLTRPLLLRLSALLPSAAGVFELQPGIPVDSDVFEACRELYAAGYHYFVRFIVSEPGVLVRLLLYCRAESRTLRA